MKSERLQGVHLATGWHRRDASHATVQVHPTNHWNRIAVTQLDDKPVLKDRTQFLLALEERPGKCNRPRTKTDSARVAAISQFLIGSHPHRRAHVLKKHMLYYTVPVLPIKQPNSSPTYRTRMTLRTLDVAEARMK